MLTTEEVERKLLHPMDGPDERADEGVVAASLEEWFRPLSDSDKRAVLSVVATWLRDPDGERVVRAMWFVRLVEPAPCFIPILEELAKNVDQELRATSHQDPMFLGYLGCLAALKVTSVISYLHKWAIYIDGPTFDWTWTGLEVLRHMLWIDKTGALTYAKRIARSSRAYRPPLMQQTLLGSFVRSYVWMHPEDLCGLGRAFSSTDAETKQEVMRVAEKEVPKWVLPQGSDWTDDDVEAALAALRGSLQTVPDCRPRP